VVTGEPLDPLRVERVRREHGSRSVEDRLGGDLASVEVFSLLDSGRELDVQTDEVTAKRERARGIVSPSSRRFLLATGGVVKHPPFLRDDHDGSRVGGMDGATLPNVREIGQRDHVQHSPNVVYNVGTLRGWV
jgi:hypothetical protein